MRASAQSDLVAQLMVELAGEDAARDSVNEVLYRRSARYRGELDATLFERGRCVGWRRGCLVVMCAHCPFCPHPSQAARGDRESAGSGPCRRELARLAA